MNALDPATQAVIYTFGAVSLLSVWAAVAVTVKGWPGLGSPWWTWRRTRLLVALAPVVGHAVRGFLERSFRDIVEGFKDGLEWLVYGVGHA
jgi:hypothetical protein